MTIGGIWAYYKSKIGYRDVGATTFHGAWLAVDHPGTMHRMRAVCKRDYLRSINPFETEVDDAEIDKVWLLRLLKQVMEYLSLGFVPVFVFDGEKSPLKLANAGADRIASNKATRDKWHELKAKHAGTDPLLIPSSDVAEARALLTSLDRLPRESTQNCIALFQGLGLPWALSKGEAERTCSLLNRDGVCRAVISQDGDCFAFGAQMILRERIDVYDSEGFGSIGFSTAEIEPLLDSVGMEFDLFQQLCIMAGTDFNRNIPAVSFNKSIPLLREHRSIRRIGKYTEHDVSVLNYKAVAREFAIVPWQETALSWSLELQNNQAQDQSTLAKYGYEHLALALGDAKTRALAAQK